MSVQYDFYGGFDINIETVPKEEYENEIKFLKEENLKLKKDIELLKNQIKNNDFIISITTENLNKDDKLFEEKFNIIILYIKSLLSSEYFINNHMIEIDKHSEYLIDILLNYHSSESQNYTSSYLKRRNLCLSRKLDSFRNHPGPKYYLIESNQFLLKRYTDKDYYQILF
jgi:hypothetical protein